MRTRTPTKARPQLETLESMTLLSGVAAAMPHHGHHAEVSSTTGSTPSPGSTITLSGTEHGLYSSHQGLPDTGTRYRVLFATGRVSPLGPTFTNGSFQTPGFIMGGTVTGSLVLRAPRGSVTLQLSGTAPTSTTTTPANTLDLTYTITKGTGAFKGDQGTGTVDVTINSSASFGFFSQRNGFGRITLDFVSATTPTPTT